VSRSKRPNAPRHLKAAGRRLWRAVVNAYELETHHLEILAAACEACDRMTEARELVDEEGITVEGRFGARTHPAVAVELNSRTAMLRAIRELGVDIEAVSESRPPSRYR
jgi:P27 family predicted phage terminase small subunit